MACRPRRHHRLPARVALHHEWGSSRTQCGSAHCPAGRTRSAHPAGVSPGGELSAMTPTEETDFRVWATGLTRLGDVRARQALELLAEVDQLRRTIQGLADRVAAQAELLAGRAEKPCASI